MRSMSIRELRNQSGSIQEAVARDTLTLTVSGKPVALMVGLESGEDPGELERLIHAARAQRAVSLLRTSAWQERVDQLGPEEIEGEVRRAHAERKR